MFISFHFGLDYNHTWIFPYNSRSRRCLHSHQFGSRTSGSGRGNRELNGSLFLSPLAFARGGLGSGAALGVGAAGVRGVHCRYSFGNWLGSTVNVCVFTCFRRVEKADQL